jgi:NHL repeat
VQPSSSSVSIWGLPLSTHKEFFELSEPVGKAGSGNGQFSSPSGIALNTQARNGEALTTKGLVYVTDTGNHRVQVLKYKTETGASLQYSAQFGKSGNENGQFTSPGGVAVEAHGGLTNLKDDVLVADPGGARLQLFSEARAYLHQ